MSANTDVEKEAISDYSTIFQEDIDWVKEQLDELGAGFMGLTKFFLKKNKDKESTEIVQFQDEEQEDFINNAFKVSTKLDAVYPVVRDINEIFTINPQELRQQGTQAQPQQTPNQVIQVNPNTPESQGGGFLSKVFQRNTTESGLPKSLEDAWNRTQEWQITTMNIPNLWSKFMDWHEKGIIRQNIFGEGMEDYLRMEKWYLIAVLQPNITKMVTRGLVLVKDIKLVHLKDIYTGTLQTKKEIDQMNMFQQQSGSKPV
jgi:hypothetical protein